MASVISRVSAGTASAGSTAVGQVRQHSIGAWLRAFEASIFGSLQIIQKKHVPHPTRTIIGMAVKFLQLSAFALSSHAGYKWNETTIKPFAVLSELSTVPGYISWISTTTYFGLYFFALAWVILFLGLFTWSTVSFMRQSWPVLWPLKILATMGSVSATHLYIPLFYLLMSGFSCVSKQDNPFWLNAGYQCYAGAHLSLAVVTAILTALFVILCTLFTLVYMDSHPLSSNLAAKAHGRADFGFLCIKTGLVVLVEVFPHSIGATALSVIVTCCGVLLTVLYAWMLPFSAHSMNKAMLAITLAFSWFGLCLIITELYPSFDAAVMVYSGGPVAAVAGASIADWRAAQLTKLPIASISTVYGVELKLRFHMHQLAWGHPTDQSAGFAASQAANQKQEAAIVDDMDGVDDTEVRTIQLRQLLPRSQVKEAEALLKEGLVHCRHSAFLCAIAARFYGVYSCNRHMQMSFLIRAEKYAPPIDVRFTIFQTRRASEDGAGGKGQMSAISRVAFEKHMIDVRKYVKQALARQVEFWGELAEAKPDISRCHRLCSDINFSINAAERAFNQLLQLNPQSLLVLRMYSDFTMYVLNDQEKANVLIAEAERIEEQQSREHQREGGTIIRVMEQSNLDVMADNTAVITIGGSLSNLGIILDVSPYTTKLFGYSRWQLERRNISMLIPSPLAEGHDIYLKKYLEHGEGRVVDYTRVVFGLHRAGHMFPMILNVREQPAADGPPAFVGIMRALATHENHILMRSDFTITCATQASLALLNIEPAALQQSEVRMTDWVQEWPHILSELKEQKGTTLCVDSTQARAAAEQRAREQAASRSFVGETAGMFADDGGASIWIRGHLQHISVPTGEEFWVLHWARMSTDAFTVSKAQERRRRSLGIEGPVTAVIASPVASPLRTPNESPLVTEAAASGKRRPSEVNQDYQVIRIAGNDKFATSVTSPGQVQLPSSPASPFGGSGEDDDRHSLDAAASAGSDQDDDAQAHKDDPQESRIKVQNASQVFTNASGTRRASQGKSGGVFGGEGSQMDAAGADRGSYASSKRSVGRKLQDRLRHAILESNGALLKGLVWLRAVGLVILAVTGALGIGVCIFITNEFTAYTDVLRECNQAAEAMRLSSEMVQTVGWLTLCQKGWMTCLDDQIQEARNTLLIRASTFSSLHRSIYAVAKSLGYQADYESPNLHIRRLQTDPASGSLQTALVQTTLLQAGLDIVTATQTIATLPVKNITAKNPSVAFLLENLLVNGSIHDALNATVFTWMESSDQVADEVTTVSVAVYVSMVVMVLLMGLCMILPIIIHVDKTRDGYLKPFVELPAVVPTKLKQHAEKRLRIFRATEKEEEDSSGSDRSDFEEGGLGDEGDLGSVSGAETNWAALIQGSTRSRMASLNSSKGKLKKDGAGPNTSLSAANRKYKKRTAALCLLLVKFAVPLLIILTFFTAIFAQTIITLQKMHVLQSATVIADQRLIESEELATVVRNAVIFPGAGADLQPTLQLVQQVVGALTFHHRAVTFTGIDVEPPADQLNHVNFLSEFYLGSGLAEMDQLLYGDACALIVDDATGALNQTNCANFRGGIVTRGLHGCIQEYTDMASRIIARRARAIVAENATDGVGILVSHDGTHPFSIPDELLKPDLQDLATYSDAYLGVGTSRLSRIFWDATWSQFQYQKAFLVAFLAVFLIVFVFYQVFIYLPQVYRTNNEIKDERLMLLLLPAGVISAVPQLQDIVQELLEARESKQHQV